MRNLVYQLNDAIPAISILYKAESPSGQSPLGRQIAFGAFVFVSGIYHSNNAYRLGSRITPGAGVLYLICGTTLMFLGLGILFANFLS